MTISVGGLTISADRGRTRLLDDKLEIPALGLAVVRRDRLDDLMDQAVGHRVTLVTGPAGAGKTVACASWAGRAGSGPVAWVTLDAGDREPARFWRYVAAAVGRAGAMSPAEPERPSPTGAGPAGPGGAGPGGAGSAADGYAQQLLARIGIAGQPVTLVLDDVHELAGSEVLAGLDELVHHAPPGLRLVLAGRYPPGLSLAKLRVSGQVGDVGPAELACTSEEAAAYLATLGVPADAGRRDAIMRQTEGWMAGLRLLSMTLPPAAATDPSGPPGPASASGPAASGPSDLGGASRPSDPGGADEPAVAGPDDFVTDYLCDEVLGPLPAATRQFLLRTSLTETVSPDLAQALTGDPAAAAALEQLSRENGLIRPARPGQPEYRYHPMLKAALQAVLRREQPAEVPALLGQLARWHAGRGEILAAIRAAVHAGDWDFGVRVLRDEGPVAPPPSGWGELEECLSAFPPERRSNEAALAIALASARLWQGDPDGALPHLDCAESALAGLTGRSRATEELALTALQVMRLAPGGGDLTAEWQLASRAHGESRSVADHRATGLLWLALGCAHLGRLQVQPARTALQHASSQLAAGGLTAVRERARSWESVACAWYGDLAGATRIAAEVAESPAAQAGDLVAILAVGQARAHLARDEPEAAAILLDQADQAAAAAGGQPAGEPVVGVLTGILRVRIAIDEGNLQGARGLVRLLTELAAGEQAAAALIAVLDAEISLAAGERERARATLGGLPPDGLPPDGLPPDGLPPYGQSPDGQSPDGQSPDGQSAAGRPAAPEAVICEARLLMADEDDKSALKVLEPLIAGPGGPVPLTSRLTALLAAVTAHRRLNQAAEAAERLEEALALAEPDDQAGSFIAAGPPIRSALTVLITPSSPCAGLAGRILDRFDGRLPRGLGPPSGAQLTESELAVLRFLPSHMTNQEIAESLFLSINTIKTHLSSVYRKLGVTSRRQAIAQGRRLELL
jgi:LuxR family maltose regulon positive regulatory protein